MDNKQRQIGGIQTQLQQENLVFNNVIYTLECLEYVANAERNVRALPQTVTESSLGFSNNHQSTTDWESCLNQMLLQCTTLHYTSIYDDEEVFNIAVEAFLKDILEWYAGRELLDFYDVIDACIIPITAALRATGELEMGSNITELFEKYVYKFPNKERTKEEGYNEVKAGVEAWILGQHYAAKPKEQPRELITTHERGTATDGYKRIITALTVLFDNSEPAKTFCRVVNRYLPNVAQQYPDINEGEIEKLYQRKTQGLQVESESAYVSKVDADIYPLLYKAVKDVLEKNNVEFSEINIAINIMIKK